MSMACSFPATWPLQSPRQPVRTRPAATRPLVCRCVAIMAKPDSSWRSAAPAHLAFMTPGQFSSFHGSHMMLPSIYVSRAKMATGARMRMPPQMSFLGVGAPEALLVGVVALVVFGPKGLADAAKSIGNTLRAFQPTIKEVVSVSQDIKGTLERELGLDELRDAARVQPRARASAESIGSMEDLVSSSASNAGFAAADDSDMEAKRRASAAAAWGGQPPVTPGSEASSSGQKDAGSNGQKEAPAVVNNIPGTLTQPAQAPQATQAAHSAPAAPAAPAAAPPAAPAPALGTLSDEQLEAELARRKSAQQKV